MDNVILQSGKRIDLAQLNFIKKGGVGSVYALTADTVLKVFHQYDQQRVAKLLAFIAFLERTKKAGNRFPSEVVVPIELAYDARKQVVGFTMEKLPRGLEAMSQLCQSTYRNQFRVSSVIVARIFLAGQPVVEAIHKAGACVGDFNYRNVFFGLGNIPIWRIIDCDSFVFDKFASGEGDVLFLPPELYGIDLSNPVYKPCHDWYSFAVMFFMGLTMGHPFGGGHRKIRTIFDRAKAGISVFEREVVYPTEALPLAQVITPSLKSAFLGYFKNGERNPFPLAVIQGYIDEKEGKRPVVVVVPVAVVQPVMSSATSRYQISSLPVSKAKVLLKTKGPILFSVVIKDQLFAIADENGKAVLYQTDIGSSYDSLIKTTRQELFTLVAGCRFGLFRGTEIDGNEVSFVVVNPPYSNELELWEVGKVVRRIKQDIETNIFLPTGHAIFRTSDNFLYLMISAQLFAFSIERGEVRRLPLRPFRREQTWFAVDQSSQKPRALVFYVSFGDLEFILVDNDKAYPITLSTLENDEVMTEISVRFDKRGILVIRKTEKKKEDYIRLDVLDVSGKLRYSAPPVKKSDHFYSQVHGRIYRGSIDQQSGKIIDLVLHPTSDGIYQERLQETKLVNIPTDSKAVDERTSLFAFFLENRRIAGILAVNEDEVYRIG